MIPPSVLKNKEYSPVRNAWNAIYLPLHSDCLFFNRSPNLWQNQYKLIPHIYEQTLKTGKGTSVRQEMDVVIVRYL